MGAFSTKKTLYGDTARIPQVAEKIRQAFVLITIFVFPAVVIAQVWGMVQQSKLDEKALAIAERGFYRN